MRKYDFTKCLDPTIALVFNAVLYNYEKFPEFCETVFPGWWRRVFISPHASRVHAVVIDGKNDKVFHINRGTGGKNVFGEFRSWLNNFNIFTGMDGVHNGFQKIGNKNFEEAVKWIYNRSVAVIVGHSQGTGPAQYEPRLIVENNVNVGHIYVLLFATAPCYDKTGARVFLKYIHDGKITAEDFENPGDPIYSEFIRDEHSFLRDGVNVAKRIKLADIIRQESKILNGLAHSPTQYLVSYLLHLMNLRINSPLENDYELIRIALKYTIN